MFKKKEKTMKEPKEKKVRTMKVGTHKKSVLLLWAVLLASTSFGVYKNFTAIDTTPYHYGIQLHLDLPCMIFSAPIHPIGVSTGLLFSLVPGFLLILP